MRRFFEWLANRLRPLHRNGLAEELQIPEIPFVVFQRGWMRRSATFAVGSDSPFGIYELIGLAYAYRANRAWRPRELHLMEDISLAFHEFEEYRQRGLAIDAIRFQRLVETLANYFHYLGEKRTKAEVRALVQHYLDEHSVADPEPDPAAYFRIPVDLPLLEELRRIDAEMAERFEGTVGKAGLWDLGLILDKEIDASRSPSITPINSRTFAHTGLDGAHFSLLVQDGAITEDSPVILTVPVGALPMVVGENLFDFLCFGCRHGYCALMELAYDRDTALEAFTNPASLGSDDSDRQLLDYLTTRLELQPWTSAERFHALQRKYGPRLQLPPE